MRRETGFPPSWNEAGIFTKRVGRRVGKEANAANAVLHRNPYPTVLVGIGAGALLGFLVACRLNGRSD